MLRYREQIPILEFQPAHLSDRLHLVIAQVAHQAPVDALIEQNFHAASLCAFAIEASRNAIT